MSKSTGQLTAKSVQKAQQHLIEIFGYIDDLLMQRIGEPDEDQAKIAKYFLIELAKESGLEVKAKEVVIGDVDSSN